MFGTESGGPAVDERQNLWINRPAGSIVRWLLWYREMRLSVELA